MEEQWYMQGSEVVDRIIELHQALWEQLQEEASGFGATQSLFPGCPAEQVAHFFGN